MRFMQKLALSDCADLDDAAVKLIATKCHRLQSLQLANCVRITDKSMFYLVGYEDDAFIDKCLLRYRLDRADACNAVVASDSDTRRRRQGMHGSRAIRQCGPLLNTALKVVSLQTPQVWNR
jgi:hypothetical protein